MPVPHAVARFNQRYTNRFVEPIARRFGGVAVVHHVGRRSGRAYATPVRLFGTDADDVVLVVLTYGMRADWIRNLLVSGGAVVTDAGTASIEQIDVVDRSEVTASLPRVVRLGLTLPTIRDVARLSLGPAVSDG